MAPQAGDKKPERASLLGSINPWGASRRNTAATAQSSSEPEGSASSSGPSTATAPVTVVGTPAEASPPAGPTTVPFASPQDHSISPYYGRSARKYPVGCPPLNVLWFHAVDVPKRKALWFKAKKTGKDEKPPGPPKKYVAFSVQDSRALEAAYQTELEEIEGNRRKSTGTLAWGRLSHRDTAGNLGDRIDGDERDGHDVTVPVNEDFLFDVNIKQRELQPVYWLGPVYDVRRGSWFYQEGSTLRPCEENLAAQLEEGYLKARPWLYANVTPKGSVENLRAAAAAAKDSSSSASGGDASSLQTKPSTPTTATSSAQLHTHRLFGQYMNHVATYQDPTTAWLSTDGVLSWVTSTMYERFKGGGYMSGIKVVRGYSEPKKTEKTDKADKADKAEKRRSTAAASTASETNGQQDAPSTEDATAAEAQVRGSQLQRKLSSLIGGGGNKETKKREEEEIRQLQEEDMEADYSGQNGETQGREIEHLILVTHGIGQLLGIRMESLNFVHDVNMLRKTLKGVYADSPSLRALNAEPDGGPGNCRIQVLPVCWRHLLDFPRRNEARRQEQDLSDVNSDEDEYPNLDDITIEGMAFARSLISDLALDVLMFQSAYRDQISDIVLRESNRIYQLFLERNPTFQGTVHVIGHSLGSAILFDILCRQPTSRHNRGHFHGFDFDVDDFYCLGSPVGLFQMLEGRTIAARPRVSGGNSPLDPLVVEDWASSGSQQQQQQQQQRSVSSPRVAQLFNVFHPSDPISYRLEPLIAPAMAGLKPQALPYTKKGLFGSVTPQGLTGIGAKVGQSVSGLWSSLSAGIASNILNRSLGLTQEDVARLEQQQQQQQQQQQAIASADGGTAGANAAGAGATGTPGAPGDISLADAEVETLFAHFQKKRASMTHEETGGSSGSGSGSGTSSANATPGAASNNGGLAGRWQEDETRAQRVRREEAKVRALNRNGRVDYSIQESVLDFNPINTIASHMAYWSDEDVSHFIMSQVLSRTRPTRKRKIRHVSGS